MPRKDLSSKLGAHARCFQAENQIVFMILFVLDEIIHMEGFTDLADRGFKGWTELPVDTIVINIE